MSSRVLTRALVTGRRVLARTIMIALMQHRALLTFPWYNPLLVSTGICYWYCPRCGIALPW